MSWDQALAKIGSVGDSFVDLTESFDIGDLGDSLPALLENLELLTGELRQVVGDNRSQLSSTIDNFETFSATLAEELPRLTEQMQTVLAQIDATLAENRTDLSSGLGNLRTLTESAQMTVENLNEITERIASGEGTLGKLVTSEEAHDSLVGSLDAIEEGVATLSDTLGRVRQLELGLGFDGWYLNDVEEERTAFEIDIDPQSDRFYRLAVVDDPRGRVRRETETLTVTLPDGSTEVTTTSKVKTEDKLTISAQLGLQLDRWSLRAGLIESGAGAGIDWTGLDDRLMLSLEAFDFSREQELEPRAAPVRPLSGPSQRARDRRV